MMEMRWTAVNLALAEFQSFLSPGVPKLSIQAATDRDWTQEQYRAQCATGIFDQRGVYLLFDRNGALQYVGVAMRCFHDRIWSHDDWIQRRWIDVIAFPDTCYFLGPALEFFLIARLHPPRNTQYRDYEIPTRSVEQTPACDVAVRAAHEG